MYDETALSRWIEQAIEESGIVWEPFPDDRVHYVPFGSLLPAGAANLLAVPTALRFRAYG